MDAPQIVSPEDWQAAHEELLVKEKAHMRAGDELSAERRAQPRMRVEKDYVFEGPEGELALPDLFEGRSQLIVYHFMWQGPSDPNVRCTGCSMIVDNLCHLSHLRARDVTFALVSRDAPLDEIEAFKERMDWDVPWYSSSSEFHEDHDVRGGSFGLNVFLREHDDIQRTYFTSSRGGEDLGTVWSYLDRTPYGRQEKWQEAPAGTPQGEPYSWWRKHDEYEHLTAAVD